MAFAEALMSETRRIRSGGKRLEAEMKEAGWQKRWSSEGRKRRVTIYHVQEANQWGSRWRGDQVCSSW